MNIADRIEIISGGGKQTHPACTIIKDRDSGSEYLIVSSLNCGTAIVKLDAKKPTKLPDYVAAAIEKAGKEVGKANS